MIAALEKESPQLWGAYKRALRFVAGINSFVRSGVRFPLTGVGRVNLFGLFAETARTLVATDGRVGQLLPSGIVTDDSTKLFFQAIVDERQIVSFFDFENRKGLFPAVHASFKFGVLTLARSQHRREAARFAFFAESVEDVRNSKPGRQFELTPEAKYFHQYDHRWATSQDGNEIAPDETDKSDSSFEISPRYWFSGTAARERFGIGWKKPWTLAIRKIARSTDERTLIATIVPSLAVSDSAKVLIGKAEKVEAWPVLIANLASFAMDFVARQKLGGTNMSGYIVEQLPVLPAERCREPVPWYRAESLETWIQPRVLELLFTAWDLEPFARDIGYSGAPFRWDPARRELLRAELDAAFLILYGLSRDDSAYVLDSFPIARKNDEKVHKEYRTKRIILEMHDAMSEATRTDRSYQTRLDPPPADPRMTHPTRRH